MSDAPSETPKILTPFGPYRTPQDTADIVEILEAWVTRAKAGEIVCLAIAGLSPNDRVVTNWRSGSQSMFSVIGLVAVLNDEILSAGRDK